MSQNVAMLLIVVALVSPLIWFTWRCLADLAQAEQVYYLPRGAWALLCVITIPLGGILYLLYGKGPRRLL